MLVGSQDVLPMRAVYSGEENSQRPPRRGVRASSRWKRVISASGPPSRNALSRSAVVTWFVVVELYLLLVTWFFVLTKYHMLAALPCFCLVLERYHLLADLEAHSVIVRIVGADPRRGH